MDFEFKVVEQGTGSLMPIGLHKASIVSVIATASKTLTPQIEVRLANEKNQIRNAWYNMRGYKRNSAGQLVDKKNQVIHLEGLEGKKLETALNRRIEDPALTLKCQEIFGKFLNHAGLEPDRKFKNLEEVGEAIVKNEVLVGVMKERGYEKVSNTFHVDAIDAAERTMSKKLGYEVVLDAETENAIV